MKSPEHPSPPLQSRRTTVQRLPKRAAYERDTVHRILDAGLHCHVGFSVDDQPYVIPTIHARVGERLYVHGSAASRMLRRLEGGVAVCVTVTLVDGLVLARSAFHHSMNYRSVVLLGRARAVDDPAEKIEALHAVVEHIMPGRWAHVRAPNDQELKATTVLALPIAEASAKIRSGGPLDDAEDMSWPVWAGVVPLATQVLAPVAETGLLPGLELPDYVRDFRR